MGRLALWKRWALRLSLAVVAAVCVGYLPYHIADGAGSEQVRRLRAEVAETDRAISELRRDNAVRRNRVEGLKSDVHVIEEIARDDLGLVYEGEVLIRFAAPAGGEQ